MILTWHFDPLTAEQIVMWRKKWPRIASMSDEEIQELRFRVTLYGGKDAIVQAALYGEPQKPLQHNVNREVR